MKRRSNRSLASTGGRRTRSPRPICVRAAIGPGRTLATAIRRRGVGEGFSAEAEPTARGARAEAKGPTVIVVATRPRSGASIPALPRSLAAERPGTGRAIAGAGTGAMDRVTIAARAGRVCWRTAVEPTASESLWGRIARTRLPGGTTDVVATGPAAPRPAEERGTPEAAWPAPATRSALRAAEGALSRVPTARITATALGPGAAMARDTGAT